VTLPSNGFQDRLVMTASISLRILFCRVASFAQLASESGGAVRPIRHFRNSKYITDSVRCQGFFARPRAAAAAAVFASRLSGWEIFERMGDFREACAGQRGRVFRAGSRARRAARFSYLSPGAPP
jgi:hypothetical protein